MNTENQAGLSQVDEARGKDGAVVVKEGSETLLESLSSICAVLAVGIFVMTFVFQNFVIPSGSMEKTLLIGDHVLVDRINLAPPSRWAPFVHYREPQRGDVIVFLKPNPETPDLILVKRLIGVPGDRIHLIHGVVYLLTESLRTSPPRQCQNFRPIQLTHTVLRLMIFQHGARHMAPLKSGPRIYHRMYKTVI